MEGIPMAQNSGEQKGKIVVHIDPDLADLIPGFITHRHEDVQSIQQALKTSDFETIRILGHSMKGSGAGYGFDAISEIGLSLEQAAKAGNPEEIQKQVHALSTYLECVD